MFCSRPDTNGAYVLSLWIPVSTEREGNLRKRNRNSIGVGNCQQTTTWIDDNNVMLPTFMQLIDKCDHFDCWEALWIGGKIHIVVHVTREKKEKKEKKEIMKISTTIEICLLHTRCRSTLYQVEFELQNNSQLPPLQSAGYHIPNGTGASPKPNTVVCGATRLTGDTASPHRSAWD